LFLVKLAGEIGRHLQTHYAKAQFWAVGVSVPGLLERMEGRLVFSPNLGWRDVPVRALLENELKLPVYVENDANVAALSELWYGPLDVSEAHSILFVLVVEGIGTGFILNGELHIGTRVGSGGFGHMSLESEGPLCSCGNVGCWEALASDEATLREFRRNYPERADSVRSMHDLISLALGGDAGAFRQYAGGLAAAGWERQRLEGAGGVHLNRRTVRSFVRQKAQHGAGVGWLGVWRHKAAELGLAGLLLLGPTYYGNNNSLNEPPFGIGFATIRYPITHAVDLQISGDNIFNAWPGYLPIQGGGVAIPFAIGPPGATTGNVLGPATWRFVLSTRMP